MYAPVSIYFGKLAAELRLPGSAQAVYDEPPLELVSHNPTLRYKDSYELIELVFAPSENAANGLRNVKVSVGKHRLDCTGSSIDCLSQVFKSNKSRHVVVRTPRQESRRFQIVKL